MIAGFKKFLMRGNVIDLAVAVVMGTAFAKVTSALVDNLIMPVVSAVAGQKDFANLELWHFKYGLILSAVIDFVLTAAAIYFFILVPINAIMDRRKKNEEIVDPGPTEAELLAEIRDLLRQRELV